MLAYPMEEACELLDTKLEGAKQKMEDCEEDLDFLREQITVSVYSVAITCFVHYFHGC